MSALLSEVDHHTVSKEWLEAALNGSENVATWEPVLCSVVRVATLRRPFKSPATLEQALQFVEEIRGAPGVIQLQPGPDFWQHFESMLLAKGVGGNSVSDAMIAALALEHNCTIVTNDRDFFRFPGVQSTWPS